MTGKPEEVCYHSAHQIPEEVFRAARRMSSAQIRILGATLVLTTSAFLSNRRTVGPTQAPHLNSPWPDMLRDFVARYKQAHPEMSSVSDMESREVLERLRARQSPAGDLWWGAAHTPFRQPLMKILLAPYRPSWADKVPDFARRADRWYGTTNAEVIVL